jgi:hypothetical protein
VPVLSASILLPRTGAWVADVQTDGDGPADGAPVVLAHADGLAFAGAVVRGGPWQGAWRGRIVGGRGGLSRELQAAPYRNVTLAIIVEDLLREAGELPLAVDSDADALALAVGRWLRAPGPAGHALAECARVVGRLWRVRADGAVWIGADTYPEVVVGIGTDVLLRDRGDGWVLLGGDVLGMVPGIILTLPDGSQVRADSVRLTVGARETSAVVWGRDG